MNQNRGPWYLLTGLIIGLVFGLVYAWVIDPVEYQNTNPKSLNAGQKDQYRQMIANAYAANPDLVRARARIRLLDDPNAVRTLAEQAQRLLAEEGSLEDARALSALSTALSQGLVLPSPTP